MKINQCKNIGEIRSNIDRIDNEIVKLISERSQYVKQAAKFKTNTDAVKAPKRVEQVIEKVRGISLDQDINPDIVEKVYRTMISNFINYELQEHEKLK